MKATMHRTFRFKFMPDMDPFFLDGEEDQLLSETSPSEDIWKKFEFLPTPPRSPSAEEKSDDERFSLVSDFLFDDDFLEFNRRQAKVDGEIIFDCMWSGRVGGAATTTVLQQAKTVVEAPLACMAMPVAAVPLSPLPGVLSHFAPPFEVVPTPTECVDPYPLSDHSYHVVSKIDEEQETTITLTPVPKKDLLGVQTPSDSDDDEVDVETISEKFLVHKPRTRRGSLPSQLSPQVQRQLQRTIATKTKSSKKLLCPRSNLHTAKAATVSSSSSNNLAAKSRRDDRKRSYHYNHLRKSRQAVVAAKLEKEQEQQQKRKADARKRKWKSVRVKENTPIVPCSPVKKSRFGGSSRTSSDSEDLDKRKEHNDLERRRRNDLKSSFQYLRQNVPDLACQERAPKVLILRKAVEYIEEMMVQHAALEKKQKIEEKKNAQLQRKLAGLQRIAFGSR